MWAFSTTPEPLTCHLERDRLAVFPLARRFKMNLACPHTSECPSAQATDLLHHHTLVVHVLPAMSLTGVCRRRHASRADGCRWQADRQVSTANARTLSLYPTSEDPGSLRSGGLA